MLNVLPNYRTKRALKLALAQDTRIWVVQHGERRQMTALTGEFSVEGPAEGPNWTALVRVRNGVVMGVVE